MLKYLPALVCCVMWQEAAERDESREEDGSTHPDTATGRPAPNCTTYTVTTQPQSTLTATQPATSAATQAATSATTPPATQPTTPPATQPTTQPAMQPSTQQSTPQSPQQSTQPSTQQSPQKQLHVSNDTRLLSYITLKDTVLMGNCAHYDFIWFLQHNNLSNFEY